MFYDNLKNKPVSVQCTWANAYTTPKVDRGLCLRSYDRKMLYDNYYNIYKYHQAGNRTKDFITNPVDEFTLGHLTGNTQELGEAEWMEVELLYTNRTKPTPELNIYNYNHYKVKGWMRLSDINFDGKNGELPPAPPPVDPNPVENKSNWLKWILGGLTALSFFK